MRRSSRAGWWLPGFLALLLVAVVAWGRAPGAAEQIPRRIVSLSPALTEILFSLGLGDRVVGVTAYCDYPPEARTRAKVGGFTNPSVEAVLALEPDLVVASPAAGNREAVRTIERAGVPVAVYGAETLDDTFAAILGLGERCGAQARARALADRLRERLEAVRRRVEGMARPRVLFCLQLEPLIAAGRGTLPDELLAIAGGINVVTNPRYPRLSVEAVLALAPDVIIQARMDQASESAHARAEAFWRRWRTLPAVRAGRLYVWDATTALRTGPRIAEAAEHLAVLLHGEPAEAP